MKAKRKRRELLLYAVALVLFLAFLYYVTRERDNSLEGKTDSVLALQFGTRSFVNIAESTNCLHHCGADALVRIASG
jgi:hypothetical protein